MESLGVPHGADVDAELPIDASSVAERELGATAAGVEDDERAVGQPEPRLHGQVGDPALFLAGDDLDRDAAPLLDQVEEGLAVGGRAQAHRADGGDAVDPQPGGLGRHPRDRRGGPLDGGRGDRAGFLDPLAQPGHLGAVGDRGPGSVGLALADVELDRVGPHVDHGLATHRRPASRADRPMSLFQPARIAGVGKGVEPHGADGGDDLGRVRILDGDRWSALSFHSAITSVSSATQPWM